MRSSTSSSSVVAFLAVGVVCVCVWESRALDSCTAVRWYQLRSRPFPCPFPLPLPNPTTHTCGVTFYSPIGHQTETPSGGMPRYPPLRPRRRSPSPRAPRAAERTSSCDGSQRLHACLARYPYARRCVVPTRSTYAGMGVADAAPPEPNSRRARRVQTTTRCRRRRSHGPRRTVGHHAYGMTYVFFPAFPRQRIHTTMPRRSPSSRPRVRPRRSTRPRVADPDEPPGRFPGAPRYRSRRSRRSRRFRFRCRQFRRFRFRCRQFRFRCRRPGPVGIDHNLCSSRRPEPARTDPALITTLHQKVCGEASRTVGERITTHG